MDRLLMKCACGCLENALFLSKTVQLIPANKQKEIFTYHEEQQIQMKNMSKLKTM
jgi:hypothetical protein